ncbi:nucleoside/nucleotide kinase family protein [Marinobacter sp. JSM 1782161]|uniref:nucleoside/nucleotide kinase family protein n=1 Tax=Marinobacter sp. JSM 1782161 TaxID=2685906 RepID=UPI0014034907|nr:nucleoside/nucleotide kinase family protein [Marinobacter sp. JSM 1782161]
MTPSIAEIAQTIRAACMEKGRLIVALAGPPAAGKSLLSERLAETLNAQEADCAVVVPMDGYHFDNAVLAPRGQLAIKGAPETFDPDSLHHDLARIRQARAPVAVPVFDRPLDLARAGARIVTPEHRVVIVEGNYLLLDQPAWRPLHALFDLTLFLDVPDGELVTRLIERWLEMGQDEAGALDRTHNKDMLNAALIKRESIEPDIRWSNTDTRVAT